MLDRSGVSVKSIWQQPDTTWRIHGSFVIWDQLLMNMQSLPPTGGGVCVGITGSLTGMSCLWVELLWSPVLELSILVVLVERSGVLARATAIPTGRACLKKILAITSRVCLIEAVFDRATMVSARSVMVFWTAEPNSREPSGFDSLQTLFRSLPNPLLFRDIFH